MKALHLGLWFLCFLLLEPAALHAGGRVALVVGCGKYANLPGGHLVSPAADSADVASAFKAMGYTVVGGGELRDPTREELNGATVGWERGAEQSVYLGVFEIAGGGSGQGH